jgi:hypothetical protein
MQQGIPTDPALLQELLRQRGLAAYSGNYRLAPFASAQTSPDGVSGAAPVSSDGSPMGAAPSDIANGTPLVDNGDGTLTDVATGSVVSPEEAASMWPDMQDIWGPLLAGAAGAGMGYAVGAMRKPNGNGSTQVVNGGDLTSTSASSEEPKRIRQTKRLPSNSAEVLADRKRGAIEAPAKRLPAPSTPEITSAERIRAEAIADELVKSRLVGNADPKKAPAKGVSTGPLNRDSILESVIAAIRKAKIKPSTLAKAIP